MAQRNMAEEKENWLSKLQHFKTGKVLDCKGNPFEIKPTYLEFHKAFLDIISHKVKWYYVQIFGPTVNTQLRNTSLLQLIQHRNPVNNWYDEAVRHVLYNKKSLERLHWLDMNTENINSMMETHSQVITHTYTHTCKMNFTLASTIYSHSHTCKFA